MSGVPIPKDLPLPLPAPEPILIGVLVFFFLMHIVFVNFMVGGSLLTLYYEIKGLKNKAYDKLAYTLASTITVNKSIAVVLGVGPLLAINTLYTVYFYSANALTGDFWIAVIPLVIIAFLLTYVHKYLWHAMEKVKWLHIAVSALAGGLFLFIPLIFLANINLMLFPDKWTAVQGFWDALMNVGNAFPRYFHFITACFALTGLFMVWMFRRMDDNEIREIGFERADLIRKGYRWAFWPTLLQFFIGPVVILTLPEVSQPIGKVYGIIGFGALTGMFMLFLMGIELRRPAGCIGRSF
ncbi:MAG: cytochrome C, partial [Micavibrio aeruginosavorus]